MEQRGKVIWVLIVVAALCAAAAGLFSLRFLLHKEPKPQAKKQSSSQAEGQAPPAVVEPNHMDQGIALIKKEELRLAETLIKDFPGDENPLVIMGEVCRSHGNAVEALKFYKRALKINPMRPDVHAIMGELAAKEGKFAESIAHLRKVLDMQPQTPNAHGRIGELLIKLGDLDRAIESFERELQIVPSANCYFLIGQSYLMQKESEKAKENYEAAIKIDPNHAQAHYGLATVYAKLGNQDRAKRHFETCRELKAEAREDLIAARTMNDDIIQARKNSAVGYIKAGQMYRSDGKLRKAEELLQHAARLDPENVGCLLELASLYRQINQPSEVREIHAKIGQLELKHADNCIVFGNLSADLGLLDDAEEAYRNAITLAPQKSVAYRKLARLYLITKKQLPQARQLAEKAVELEATAVNYSILSRACVMNGDGAAGMKAIKRAVELEPRNREYQRYYDLIRRMN